MGLLFLIIGIFVVVTGIQNTWRQAWVLTDSMLFGENEDDSGFLYWGLSIIVVGAIGYFGSQRSGGMRTLSRLFIALILISVLLSNSRDGKNIFQMAIDQLREGGKEELQTVGAPLPVGDSGGGEGGDIGDSLIDAGVGAITGGLF